MILTIILDLIASIFSGFAILSNSKWYLQQIAYYNKYDSIKFKEQYSIEKHKVRVVKSNLRFTDNFYAYATRTKGVPIVYWKDLDQILYDDDCDIIMDEVGRYFN